MKDFLSDTEVHSGLEGMWSSGGEQPHLTRSAPTARLAVAPFLEIAGRPPFRTLDEARLAGTVAASSLDLLLSWGGLLASTDRIVAAIQERAVGAVRYGRVLGDDMDLVLFRDRSALAVVRRSKGASIAVPAAFALDIGSSPTAGRTFKAKVVVNKHRDAHEDSLQLLYEEHGTKQVIDLPASLDDLPLPLRHVIRSANAAIRLAAQQAMPSICAHVAGRAKS